MEGRFTRRQWAVFFSCFIAYTAAYITRTNLAPALPAIAKELALSDAQSGLLTTMFAITYAAGQLLNGYLADRLNVRYLILAGLAGSAAINLLFAQTHSYPLLLLLWLVNGLFQSMLWTPIVRIMAVRFHGAARNKAVFGISMTLVVGYIAAWSLTGMVTSWLNWRAAFSVCGALTLVLAAVSFVLLGNDTPRTHSEGDVDGESPAQSISLRDILLRSGLVFVLICCILNGYVRDGIMTWAPKMLMDTQGIDMDSALGAMLIIPVINLLGILLGRLLYKWLHGNASLSIAALMGASALFALLLAFLYQIHPFLCALLLGCCSAVAYGINPLLTTIMPMDYRNTGRVALIAGMIDASIYIGTALTGILTGAIHDAFGWMSVFASWIFLSVLGAAAIGAAEWMRRRAATASGRSLS